MWSKAVSSDQALSIGSNLLSGNRFTKNSRGFSGDILSSQPSPSYIQVIIIFTVFYYTMEETITTSARDRGWALALGNEYFYTQRWWRGDGARSNGWGRIFPRLGDNVSRATRVEVWAAQPWDVGECAPYPIYEGIIVVAHLVWPNDRGCPDSLGNACRTWGWWREFRTRRRVVKGCWKIRLIEEGRNAQQEPSLV